jgi:hypothetical protein
MRPRSLSPPLRGEGAQSQCSTTFSISLTRPARNRRMFSISSGIT